MNSLQLTILVDQINLKLIEPDLKISSNYKTINKEEQTSVVEVIRFILKKTQQFNRLIENNAGSLLQTHWATFKRGKNSCS